MFVKLIKSLFIGKNEKPIHEAGVDESRSFGGHNILAEALQEFAEDPRRDIFRFEERVELAEEFLKDRTNLGASEIKRRARSFEACLTSQTEQNQLEALRESSTSMEDSGISRELCLKAIRLSVLNPCKDLERSFAALCGWDGLSEDKFEGLSEDERLIAEMMLSKDAYDRLRAEIQQTELGPISASFHDNR